MGIEFTCRLLHIHVGGIERCFYGIFIARSIKMLIQYACDSGGVGARRLCLCLSFLSLLLSFSLYSASKHVRAHLGNCYQRALFGALLMCALSAAPPSYPLPGRQPLLCSACTL